MKETTKKRFLKLLAFCTAAGVSASCLPIISAGAVSEVRDGVHEAVEAAEPIATFEIIETSDTSAEGRSIPEGAQRTGVNVNGRRVLEGRVFVIGGITYVPMFKFADWLGVFEYSTSSNGTRAYNR